MKPGEQLSIDDHAIGDLPDEITVVLAVGAYLQTGSPASHTLIVPAGATICFPKRHKVLLRREINLRPSSRIIWPCDSEHSDPEVMQMQTRANDRGLSLWITEGDEGHITSGRRAVVQAGAFGERVKAPYQRRSITGDVRIAAEIEVAAILARFE